MDLGLKGKRALVLGASRGLGAAIAATLAAEGATVIAVARSTALIDEWIAQRPDTELLRLGAASVDLGDRASIDALADMLLADGGVDIIVNNGGGPPAGAARAITADQWETQFRAMASSLFHLTERLLPPMIERGWGRIITVGSSGLEQPLPNLALSNGIRMAVLGWSKTLASEVAAHGITVNMLLPGRIHTDRVDQLDRGNAERQGKTVEQIVAASLATIPSGRYGTPQEFANVAAFIASDAASYITGAKIRVDGGLIRAL